MGKVRKKHQRDTAVIPYRITEIIAQVGGAGIHGAPCYTGGCKGLCYKERDDGRKPDASRFDEETGSLHWEVGLSWLVNVKRNQTWKMVVAYEPCDTYTVYLLKIHGPMTAAKTGKLAVLVDSADDVYCDNLQRVAEGMYDDLIERVNGGFIPL